MLGKENLKQLPISKYQRSDQQDSSSGKGVGTKPEDLRLIPGIHVVEGTSQLLQVVP